MKTGMNKSNRDLLVLFKEELMTPQAIEHEVELLHEMLYMVENIDNVCQAHEIIDLNRFKVHSQMHIIRNVLRRRELKPFIFLNNKD